MTTPLAESRTDRTMKYLSWALGAAQPEQRARRRSDPDLAAVPSHPRDERLELVGVDHDVAALRQLVALDDVLVGDVLTGLGRHLLQPDPAHGALVELVERDALLAHPVIELDRDGDESEADRPVPHWPRHVPSLPDRRHPKQGRGRERPATAQPASTARATRSVPNAVRIARYSRPVAAMTAE